MNGEVDGNSMGRTNALVNLRKKRFHKVAMRLFCLALCCLFKLLVCNINIIKENLPTL